MDLVVWRSGDHATADEIAAEVRRLLGDCDFDRPLHRVDVTVTSEGTEAEHQRTHHFTFRQQHGAFVEEMLYRNLHPMIAKRLGLWRLSNFSLQRLRSVEDVYLFRGVAHDNPKDVRLFAIAEVRDLTPVRDAAGRVSPCRCSSGWGCRQWPRCARRCPNYRHGTASSRTGS